MKKQLIHVSSITYAIKGRDILKSKGIKAYVERSPADVDRVGCGYSIFVKGDIVAAENILRDAGIKIVGRQSGDDV